MTAPDYLPVLSSGSHTNPKEGACVMEYVTVLAGEKFTDRPSCTLSAFADLAIRLNDGLDDDDRQRMVPLIPRLIGTATTDAHVLIGVSVAMLREVERRWWRKYSWWPPHVSRDMGIAWDILYRWAAGEDVSLDELVTAATATAAATTTATTTAAATATTAAAATASYWFGGSDYLGGVEAVLTAGLDAFDELSGRGGQDLAVEQWQRLAQTVGVSL